MSNYPTVYTVLENVENYIANANPYGIPYKIREVCKELSIFDWFKANLFVSNLEEMRAFLREAIKLGFTGYCCFKVGATGCANGMWAYTVESENGYSPNTGDILYRSFTPDEIYWSAEIGGKWLDHDCPYNAIKAPFQLEKAIAERKAEIAKEQEDANA